MAGGTLKVEVVSPEAVVFTGEATMVVTRTLGGGDVAFMAGHAPFLAALADGKARVHLVGGGTQEFSIHGGFVQVDGKKVSILSDAAEIN